MNKNILVSIMILLLFSYIVASTFLNAEASNAGTFQFDIIFYSGIHVILETPWYVNSSSSFNVSLIIKAETAQLEDIVVNVTSISTFIDDQEYFLQSLAFEIVRLNLSEQTVRVIPITLPENSSRIVMGEVICSWIIPPGSPIVQHTRFPIAIIADYWQQQAQKLRGELDWYKDQYDKLQDNLTELQEKYENLTYEYNQKIGELSTTQRLSVILGVTTAIFAVTTVYLFRRKPQVW
ncbi:hypothetical protein J7K27_11190 [Candidatus Bathyarchaeota archaeon]|nr:hypothetical protein [Candidatus Bathyarchaeota archaeon]